MAQDGDTITYSFNGSKVIEDVSTIDEISIDSMKGARGGNAGDGSTIGGAGGLIEGATVDVSNYDEVFIWVGRAGLDNKFGHSAYSDPFGRYGYDVGSTGVPQVKGPFGTNGGSTEIWVPEQQKTTSEKTRYSGVFVVDYEYIDVIEVQESDGSVIPKSEYDVSRPRLYPDDSAIEIKNFDDSTYTPDTVVYRTGTMVAAADTGGGGGSTSDASITTSGLDGYREPSQGFFGGAGGEPGEDGEPGGQELGAASGGTTTTGGGSQGNGEIKITYKAGTTTSETPPEAPSSLTVEVSK